MLQACSSGCPFDPRTVALCCEVRKYYTLTYSLQYIVMDYITLIYIMCINGYYRIHMVLQISTQFPANCRWQTPLRTLVSHLKVLVRLSDASAGGQGDWPWSGIRTAQLLRLRANQKSSHPHCRILTGTLAKMETMEKLQPKRRVSQPSHYYPISAQFVLLPKNVAHISLPHPPYQRRPAAMQRSASL